MDQPTSLAVVSSLSVYAVHRLLHVPTISFFVPPIVALALQSFTSSYLSFVTRYGLALFALVLLYRGIWHPLNRYPGPLKSRFTSLWRTSTIWRGKNYQLIRQLHQQYGDYVRIGPDEISIRDTSVIPIIYGNPGWQKADFYSTIARMEGRVSSLQSEQDHKEHTRRRKTWDAAFTRPALARYQNIVLSTADAMYNELLRRGKGNAKGLDFRREMMYYTWTVMYKIGYSAHGHDMVEKGPSHMWETLFETMESMLRLVTTMSTTGWLTPLATRLPPDPRVVKFLETATDQHRRRAADKGMAGDVYEALLAPLQEVGLSATQRHRLELEAEADSQLLIIAGSDTTASAMTWLWYYLLTEPGKVTYFELRRQLDIAFKEEHELESGELARRVPLLDHVINEVLRLRPPIPVGPLQRQAPATGAVIGTSQQYIPPGTKVSVSQIALSYDPRIYEEPEKFKPERWAHPDVNQAGFVPFSYGPYSCVGKQVAMQEMRHVTALLLCRLDLSLAPQFDPKRFSENATRDTFTTATVEPMPVIIQERKNF